MCAVLVEFLVTSWLHSCSREHWHWTTETHTRTIQDHRDWENLHVSSCAEESSCSYEMEGREWRAWLATRGLFEGMLPCAPGRCFSRLEAAELEAEAEPLEVDTLDLVLELSTCQSSSSLATNDPIIIIITWSTPG